MVIVARPLITSGAMCKMVKINDVEMSSLIDTGSDINFISSDEVEKLGIKGIQPTERRINGIGSRDVRSTGVFAAEVVIDAITFHTRVYVFEENMIPMKLVIGKELLAEGNVTIRQGEITISKPADSGIAGTKGEGVQQKKELELVHRKLKMKETVQQKEGAYGSRKVESVNLAFERIRDRAAES